MFHDVETRVDLGTDGQPVLVKHGQVGLGSERVRREADLLRRFAHPGMVELIAIEELDDGTAQLQLRWAGSRTLSSAPGLTVAQAAGVVAALAATLADLHDAGLTHTRLEPDHVIVSPAGRPVLCGLGGASDRQLAPADHDAHRSEDVHALGRLLHHLVGGDVEAEPIPERAWFTRRERWSGYQRRCLLNLADQATADDASHRPSARLLSANIAATVPEAALLAPEGGAEPPLEATQPLVADPLAPSRWTLAAGRVPRSSIAAIALTIAMLGTAAWLALKGDGGSAARPTVLPTEAAPSARLSVPPQSRADGSRCPVIDGPAADGNGDGCAEPVTVTDRIVTVGDSRFELGVAGDQVVIGDWRCTGGATPALLRPATGEVFVFPRYATEDVTVVASTVVAGADGLRVERRAACDVLLATRPGQPPVEIPGGGS